MNKQLQISFPQFDFQKAKEAMRLVDILKLEDQVTHLKYSIRTHKGNYTKIKKQK